MNIMLVKLQYTDEMKHYDEVGGDIDKMASLHADLVAEAVQKGFTGVVSSKPNHNNTRLSTKIRLPYGDSRRKGEDDFYGLARDCHVLKQLLEGYLNEQVTYSSYH